MSDQILNPLDYRKAMGCFATGVAVIGTFHENHYRNQDSFQNWVAMTVNSLTSVSLNPPLLLFCAREGRTLEQIQKVPHFTVNVLSQQQVTLARHFAGQTVFSSPEELAPFVEWTDKGCLAFRSALVQLHCCVQQIFYGGDHQIVVGRVEHLQVQELQRDPLLFFQGRWAKLQASDQSEKD